MKLKVITHSGGEYETDVESYDAVLVNDDLNNGDINTVVFGDCIVSRIDVKLVMPIE